MGKQICEENLCSACGACINVCPKKCISLVEDRLDCLKPYINENSCINCNLCKKVCPQINEPKLNLPLICYASYIKDFNKRLDSASGGIARAFYEYSLKNIKNSKIVGVYFDNDYQVKFLLTDKFDDIKKFQGSKYIQANPENIYEICAKELDKGTFILFIAMPCQIAAFKNYINYKKINQSNLLTVDILCHGVSPQSYFNQNLEKIKQSLKLVNIEKITFRSNRKYKNFHLYLKGKNKQDKEIVYNKYAYEEPYYYGFLKGITLRESCYSCKFSQKFRAGDITIGDFLGLAQMPSSPKFDDSPINLSMILCNTSKGVDFISKLKEDLKLYERPYIEAVEGGASLQRPFPKHKLRNPFVKLYKKGSFVRVIKKIAFWDLFFYIFKVIHKKIYVCFFMRDLLK